MLKMLKVLKVLKELIEHLAFDRIADGKNPPSGTRFSVFGWDCTNVLIQLPTN
jgi:hypothetical protein